MLGLVSKAIRAFIPRICMNNNSFHSVRLLVSTHNTTTTLHTYNNAIFQSQKRTMASTKHKRIIKLAKGYFGRANRVYSIAYHRVMKARQYAYRDRKVKKRDMRSLWIMRINAATRMYGLPYSTFVYYLNTSGISLNRKVLSDLAITEPLSFRAVIEVLKDASNGIDPKENKIIVPKKIKKKMRA